MKSREIKILTLNCNALKDEELFSKYFSLMPQIRKNKISACRFDSDKRLSLGAGILINTALSGYDTEKIKIFEGGKPHIPDCPLKFSVSHSGCTAAIAVAYYEVGCDVETKRDIKLKIAERYFNKSEYDLIKAAKSEDEKAELFFRLWTLKESFIKTTGKGLLTPLNSFEIRFKNGVPEITGEKYILKEFCPYPDVFLSVCVKGEEDVTFSLNEIKI